MSRPLTTEQMVRKCFLEGVNYRITYGMNNPNATSSFNELGFLLLARAARRFVRMEQDAKCKKFLSDTEKRVRNKTCSKTTGKGV